MEAELENKNANDDIRNARMQSNLLVFGYINEFGQSMSNNIMIPTSIIRLCHKFHFIDIESYKPSTLIPKLWYTATRNALDENNYLLAIDLAKYFVTNFDIEQKKDDKIRNVYLSVFYNIMALTFEDLKLPNQAEIYYKISIECDETTDVWLWNYCELLQQQSRYNEAKELLIKAVELQPDKLIYQFSLAQTAENMNQIHLSSEYYSKIVSKHDLPPNNGKNCLFKAVSYKKLGNFEKSKDEYENYLKLVDRDKIHGNTRYAILLFMLEKYHESLGYLEKAIKCKKDTAFTYYYMGLIMKHNQQYINAQNAFQKAMDLCPIYPKVQKELQSLTNLAL